MDIDKIIMEENVSYANERIEARADWNWTVLQRRIARRVRVETLGEALQIVRDPNSGWYDYAGKIKDLIAKSTTTQEAGAVSSASTSTGGTRTMHETMDKIISEVLGEPASSWGEWNDQTRRTLDQFRRIATAAYIAGCEACETAIGDRPVYEASRESERYEVRKLCRNLITAAKERA